MTGSEKTRHICQMRTYMAQCEFLVSTVKKYQSPVFVIFMSKNPSTNCCHHLRRVNVSYQGEISLHLDLPSQYDCHIRSPLLWALIRILYLDTARFIELLYVRSPFSFLGADCCQHRNPTLARSLRSFQTAPPRSI